MSDTANERRRFQRIAFDAPTVLVQGSGAGRGVARPVAQGPDVETPSGWNADPDQPFEAQIQLGDEARVKMEVLLTRTQAGYLGFVCRHIDLDSISHLRRLVELNLGDESLLERELAALGDIP